ncbi:response regulator [Sphingomonas sp. S2-65]|uniref:response regulator n=1 Tax=Sphingomonas sp. S2-65 TaxID=2903960 RepID=UPI001F20B13E|nr:response regulator [Sphingomonas sp. S2-65]UYY56918.1 response regulator [Sphingomonas sp. S2-65]
MPQSVDFEAVFSRSANPYVLVDRQFTLIAMNDAYCIATGRARADLLGRNMFEAFPSDPGSESYRLLHGSLSRVAESGAPDHLPLIRYDIPLAGGLGSEERYWSATHTPVPNRAGETAYILQHTVDVTELQRLRALARDAGSSNNLVEAGVFQRAQAVQRDNLALEQERAFLRSLFVQTPGFIAVLSGPDHVFTLANDAYHRVVGRENVVGQSVREALPEVVEQGFLDLLDRVYQTGQPFVGRGVRLVLSDAGSPAAERYIDFIYQPILDPTGAVTGIFVQGNDVTEQHYATEQLRRLNETLETRIVTEIAERRQAEAALQQAQKMEAIGKLTGGVAHDFNNLLQVVSGNLQLLAKDVAGNDRAERRVTNALAGVSRGAKLAAQLLAFGRRQPLEPKVVNIGRFVYGMEDMLRRAIGDAVEVETVVSGGLWNTFVDPGQVENALLNLAINARDAMDGQGKLTIEVGNAHLDDNYARTHAEVTPGQYVLLAVTDTGQGIGPDILTQVFEPFFSTKPEGKGTGLGLSMVYGFVKQSGGHVKIYSEVGQGTTVKLYLPRALQAEEVGELADTGPVVGGSETILVAEDDDEVRATAIDLLTELGYRVLKARDAASALAIVESGVAIDLLFTDVVMPGTLKSPELARITRDRYPDVAVLFTSGYTENSIVHGGRLDEGVDLLSKPYTREMLARKVRYVLANQRQRGASVSEQKLALSNMSAPDAAPARLSILLVEDDTLIRANTAELLQHLGHTVVEAASAEDATTALQTVPIDILFTDVELPGISGSVLATRARELRPHVGVIFATGNDHVAGLEGEGAVLLRKPYDGPAIAEALTKARRVHA